MHVLLVATKEDSKYYWEARKCLDGIRTSIVNNTELPVDFYISAAKKEKIDTIVTCNPKILESVLRRTGRTSTGSCEQWAGAAIHYNGIRFIITKSFKQIKTTLEGKAVYKRHVLKHLVGKQWELPHLEWTTVIPGTPTEADALTYLSDCILIAVDIETKRQPLSEVRFMSVPKNLQSGIAAVMYPTDNAKRRCLCAPIMDMVGYYGVKKGPDGKLQGKGFVLDMNSMEAVYLMRKLNQLKPPKVMQNGGYDSTYFVRYNAPLYNWLYDTFHFMHCWYVELPRKLDFIASWFLPNYEYWKDEVTSNRHEYNIKDVYVTAWSFLLMLMEAPDFVYQNYLIEFRKCFPNICMGLEGLKVDEVELKRLHASYVEQRDASLRRLQTIIHPNFNPNSPDQVKRLMNITQTKKYKSTDKVAMQAWMEEGPLQFLLGSLIKDTRKFNKGISTYLTPALINGRMLYELNAGGTKTGRAASKASNLWVGTQIQNQDNNLRSMYVADPGYLLGSVDNSQSESRTTAYISEDENLINTVETAKDFHIRNASLFFGIPEEKITKPTRNLSKRVNHGSNYNMAEYKLIETMGHKNVMEAGRLIGLPRSWSAFKIAHHLLGTFVATYPDVKGKYYDEVIQEVLYTGMLVGATGWTRVCFGKPGRDRADKKHLNEYVAHPPQSLSVMMIDDALFDFWMEYQIRQNKTRLKAQIHDEVLHMCKPEVMDECQEALSTLLRRPVEVRGRTLIIPNDGGSYAERWSEL